jgi:hypothetical protein
MKIPNKNSKNKALIENHFNTRIIYFLYFIQWVFINGL